MTYPKFPCVLFNRANRRDTCLKESGVVFHSKVGGTGPCRQESLRSSSVKLVGRATIFHEHKNPAMDTV